MFCRTDLLALSQKLFSTVMMKEGEGDCVTKSYRLQRVRRDGGEKSLGWGDLDLECSLWWPPPSTAHCWWRCWQIGVTWQTSNLDPRWRQAPWWRNLSWSSFTLSPSNIWWKRWGNYQRGGIALEFRQSFCSQAFPLLASPHNDIQRAVMTVEKQQVSPPHLWQQLMAHLVFRFLDFHCCKWF